MKILVTGDIRDIANAAWISTTDEVKTKARTDEEAVRVVNFLIKNNHTSPLESVTITLKEESMPWFEKMWSLIDGRAKDDRRDIYFYKENPYAKSMKIDGVTTVTIDLLNFLKTTHRLNLYTASPWRLFKQVRPALSEMCMEFNPYISDSSPPYNIDTLLGDHNMSVELVTLHNTHNLSMSRATWRIKTPLSIAVQILRHRKVSANMVSGRYKTIYQEIISSVKDCKEIFDKVDVNLDKYLGSVEGNIALYESTMKKAQKSKSENKITNEEYKRLREFARFILPEGRLTELYVTFYLDDFYNNFRPLRESTHAQAEHIWIAKEMARTLDEFLGSSS